jgi:hypothetical protein
MQEDKNIEEYVVMDDSLYREGGGWKDKLSDFLANKYFVPVVIVLIAIIAFSLGRVSGLQERRLPVRIISDVSGEVKGVSINNSPPNPSLNLREGSSTPSESGQVVASKNGTKYHYSWCAGAKQITPQNLITFNSIEEARAAGLTPASNCKGLK